MDKKYYHAGNGEVTCYSKERWTYTSCSYHCDPKNPVGWIEGEEVYQVLLQTNYNPVKKEWGNTTKDAYESFAGERRIWIEPKPSKLEAFLKGGDAARQQSAGEVERLRRENELKGLVKLPDKIQELQMENDRLNRSIEALSHLLNNCLNKKKR